MYRSTRAERDGDKRASEGAQRIREDGTCDEGRGGGDGGAEGDAGMHPAHRGWQEGHPQGREGQAKHADGEAVPEDRHAGEVFGAEDREEGMNGRHAKSRLAGEELLQKRTTLYKV